MKWRPIKIFLLFVVSIIVVGTVITIYFNVGKREELPFDKLAASRHTDDRNPNGMFISSKNDCWMCCVFNILYRMKEFRDYLDEIDDKTVSDWPLLKILKDELLKKASPYRWKHATLQDVGYDICTFLDSNMFKYGKGNDPILFIKKLIQYLADFDTQSQYFVIKTQKSVWSRDLYDYISTPSRKGALTSLLTQEICVSTKKTEGTICEIRKRFRENLRYPKILFIIPSSINFFKKKFLDTPIHSKLIVDDKTTYHLKGIVCDVKTQDHVFAVAYIDGKLYNQDTCKQMGKLETIKYVMMAAYTLDI